MNEIIAIFLITIIGLLVWKVFIKGDKNEFKS